MIPTKYKSRISKELSFPVGAEQISVALEGVPQYERLSIGFWRHHDQTPKQTREIVDKGEPLLVLEARYRDLWPSLNETVDEDWPGKVWELVVHPVPRDRKKAVRELLLEGGLVRIRAWLEKPRSEVWRDGNHSCFLRAQFAEKGILLFVCS